MQLQCEIGWMYNAFPSYFMNCAAREAQDSFGLVFTALDIANRVSLLAMRCSTFREVISSKGTYWDRMDKFVCAADCVWLRLFENNPFAGAYYYHDEPEYHGLLALFGFHAGNVGTTPEVIEISSSSDDMSWNECLDDMDVDIEDEEVNSLVGLHKPYVRRKLFDEDDVTLADGGSMMAVVNGLLYGAHDGNPITRPYSCNVMHNRGVIPPNTLSPFASSCASNSPLGWSRLYGK